MKRSFSFNHRLAPVGGPDTQKQQLNRRRPLLAPLTPAASILRPHEQPPTCCRPLQRPSIADRRRNSAALSAMRWLSRSTASAAASLNPPPNLISQVKYIRPRRRSWNSLVLSRHNSSFPFPLYSHFHHRPPAPAASFFCSPFLQP